MTRLQVDPKQTEVSGRAHKHAADCSGPSPRCEDAVASIQRSVGNQAVQRLADAGGTSQGLAVSQPGDPAEREAERVADEVLRNGDRSSNTDDISTGVKRLCSKCRRRYQGGKSLNCEACEQELQRSARPGGNKSPDTGVGDQVRSLREGGQALPDATRSFFEPRFGRSLDDVRVHDDGRAASLNRALGSRAVTVGRDVYFGRGNYDPDSKSGLRLIAHELTHTIQQGAVSGRSAGDAPRIHHRAEAPLLMGSELFSSTIEICHRVLYSRVFSVSEKTVTVTADADFQHTGGRECGTDEYNMTLTRKVDYWPDDELGTCSFTAGERDASYWGDGSAGEYYLTIFTRDTGPYCCLRGDITVSEESGGSDAGCTEHDDSALDVLHTALDAAGMVPALGAVPDAVNAGIYAIEGDWVNAGVSAAALVPIFGQGATLTRFGVKVTDEAVERVGREGIEKGLKEAKEGTVRSAPTKRGAENLRRLTSRLDNPLEESAATYLKSRGDEVIGEGDVAVRRLLDIPEGSGQLTVDFLSVSGSGRFNLTEVKNSLADADIPHALEQLKFVTGKLSRTFDNAKIGKIEIVVPAKPSGGIPSFRGNYQVSGNQLVRVTDQGTEVIRVGGNVVHIRTLSGG